MIHIYSMHPTTADHTLQVHKYDEGNILKNTTRFQNLRIKLCLEITKQNENVDIKSSSLTIRIYCRFQAIVVRIYLQKYRKMQILLYSPPLLSVEMTYPQEKFSRPQSNPK